MKKSKETKDLGVNERKGMGRNEAWEVHVPASAEGFGDDSAGAFLPRPAKNRAQPHQKINECDH
jgi:hypothetical protein